MKNKNYKIFFLVAILSVFGLNSCSVDQSTSDQFVLELATVKPIDEKAGTYYLTLDDGSSLKPATYDIAYEPKAQQRVKVSYTLLPESNSEASSYDYNGRINFIQNIVTKSVIELTEDNEKEVGNDPIKILSLWVGDNYLNIHFGINMGGEHAHTLNLVKNKLTNPVSGDGTIALEFRHNSNGDPQLYGKDDYAAFDLREFMTLDAGSVTFKIKIKDLDNQDKEYTLVYKYNRKDITN